MWLSLTLMGTFTLFVHLNLKSISPARIAGLDLPVPIRPGYRYMNVSCHNLSAQTYSYICVCIFIQQDQCINWHLSWGRAREAASSQANQLLLSCQYYFCLNNSVSSPLVPPPPCRGSWSSHTWPTSITFLTTALVSALIPHLCSPHNHKKDLQGGQILPCLAPSWSPCLVCWVKVIHDFPSSLTL